MTARRLIVQDVNLAVIDYLYVKDASKGASIAKPNLHWEIDLTDMPNANASVPLTAVIQEKCSLGHWHTTERVSLPIWGPE